MHVEIVQLEVSTGPNAEQAPHNFYTSRFVEDNRRYLDELDPAEQLFDQFDIIIEDEKSRIKDGLDMFKDSLQNNLSDVLFNPVESGVEYFRREAGQPIPMKKFSKDDIELIMLEILPTFERRRRLMTRMHRAGRRTTSAGGALESSFLLLANNKKEILEFIEYFETSVTEVDQIVGEFMTLDKLEHGESLVREYFNQKTKGDYVSDWSMGEYKDEFEQEVFETVNSLTGVCLPNIHVKSSVGESLEYDVVALPVGPYGNSYAIEAKNYDRENVDEEDNDHGNLRYNLITQPKEDADRVGLDLITVVKGLTDDQFENLKRHATPSNVILLNDSNYQEKLNEVLIDNNLKEFASNI